MLHCVPEPVKEERPGIVIRPDARRPTLAMNIFKLVREADLRENIHIFHTVSISRCQDRQATVEGQRREVPPLWPIGMGFATAHSH